MKKIHENVHVLCKFKTSKHKKHARFHVNFPTFTPHYIIMVNDTIHQRSLVKVCCRWKILLATAD